jgi:predicted metal-binding membrane protein
MLKRFPSTAWKRDRLMAVAGLIAITALAWIYLIHTAGNKADMDTSGMQGMSMLVMQAWHTSDFLLTFLMWTVMMAGMMMPSATPMILTFVGIKRQRRPDQVSLPATFIFVLGYLAAWVLFSAAATLIQWGLHTANLLSPMMATDSPFLNGTLLILAGIYQFTPWKNACLSSCRTPIGFLITEWRDGARGAFTMGARHGVYCVGCCWLLMALLFTVGVMNLLWSAIIAGIVLFEKIAPSGQWISRAIGLLALAWGALLLVQNLGI